MGLDLSGNSSSETMCRIVGSLVWCLSTETSLHCSVVSTDVMSDHIALPDASRGDGSSKTSTYIGQSGRASMICSILSVAAL